MSKAYKQAGVDLEAGYESVKRIRKHVQKTIRPEVIGSVGGFGGMFDVSQLGMKEPVLVSGTDGVGTKLMLAFQMDQHDTIGMDAVAMCVNDIVVQGAQPLFFLDYIACGKSEPEKIEQIVKGIADGCEQAGCALVGGETAEMPGMYDADEYDIAGFAVGAVEKSAIVTGENIEEGDVFIGLASNGIHSNGYSLVRKVLLHDNRLDLNEHYEEFGKTLGEELLVPTRIYAAPIMEVLKQYEIKGMAHITGGGFIENIPRMLPDGLGAEIEKGTWTIPPIFRLIQEKGNLSDDDMYRVFNMGIGFVLAVNEKEADHIVNVLNDTGETAQIIGKVTGTSGVQFFGGPSS